MPVLLFDALRLMWYRFRYMGLLTDIPVHINDSVTTSSTLVHLTLYQRLSREKKTEDMLYLHGVIFSNGQHGVAVDVNRGVQCYERAVEQGGHVGAMYNLGVIYSNGDGGMDVDVIRAKALYERAVEEGGHIGSMYNLGVLFANGAEGVDIDVVRAVQFYERAVVEGRHIGSMYNLGVLFSSGAGGIPVNIKLAKVYYEMAIEKGEHAGAMNNLGVLLQKGGEGVPVDKKRAITLYSRSMRRWNKLAMSNLGILLAEESGGSAEEMEQDNKFFASAIEAGGSIGALQFLCDVARRGSNNARRNTRQAVEMLNLVIEKGFSSPSILTSLARLLLSDEVGDMRDAARAKGLLCQAISKIQYAPAIFELAALYSRGDGVDRDVEEARRLHQVAKARGVFDDGCFRVRERTKTIIKAGEKARDLVEESLKGTILQSRESFVMVLGGAGRGKTSIVRSLRGMEFVSKHIATELANVGSLYIVPDGRHVSEQEIKERRFNTESFLAGMSRASLVSNEVDKEVDLQVATCVQGEENHNCNGRDGRDESDGEVERKERESGVQESDNTYKMLPNNVRKSMVSTGGGIGSVEMGHEDPVALGGNKETASMVVHMREQRNRTMDGHVEEKYRNVIDKAQMAMTDIPFPEAGDGALVMCWDLGGQSEYEMAHCLFLGPPGVKLFVMNLERFCNKESREDEVMELCRWMQLVYGSSEDTKDERPIIIGTRRKDAPDDLSAVWSDLISWLRKRLGSRAYDAWVQERPDGEGRFRRKLEFVGIENSIAVEDRIGSGLERLQEVVKKGADEIVANRKGLPARWVALVEELGKQDVIYMTKREVEEFVKGFPGFGKEKGERERDALEALRFYRGVGRLILFEMKDEYYVFMEPEKILEFVRTITGPSTLIESRLSHEDAEKMEKGLLTEGGLEVLWYHHKKEVRSLMLELLCKFDLMMKFKQGSDVGRQREMIIGLPGLLKKGWDGLRWKKRNGQEEIVLASDFEDGLPRGLAGMLIAFLHRTLGEEQTDAEFVWSNAVILTVGVRDRVIVEFLKGQRRVLWRVRAEKAMQIAGKCVRAMDIFLKERLHASQGQVIWQHKILSDCQEGPNGCGSNESVEFGIAGGLEGDMGKLEGRCVKSECREKWTFGELMGERTWSVDTECALFDVFISHAGPEKLSVAYPLREELERGGLKTFLDYEDIRGSSKTTRDQIYEAMRKSRAAVFIISVEFVMRKWPIMELQYFLDKWEKENKKEGEVPLLIPLFYTLLVEDCKDYNLAVRDEYKERFVEEGFFKRKGDLALPMVMKAMSDVTKVGGVRNDDKLMGAEFSSYASNKILEFYFQEFKTGLPHREGGSR